MARRHKGKNTLWKALRKCRGGKLILIKDTEHPYYVSQALRNGLRMYCNIGNIFCGPLEPPLCALKNGNDKWWRTENAHTYILELVRMLDNNSPNGWHFHVPVFGIVLEWGWFRNYFFRKHFGKEI